MTLSFKRSPAKLQEESTNLELKEKQEKSMLAWASRKKVNPIL